MKVDVWLALAVVLACLVVSCLAIALAVAYVRWVVGEPAIGAVSFLAVGAMGVWLWDYMQGTE